MTTQSNNELEQQLELLTEWPGEPVEAWRAATHVRPEPAQRQTIWTRRLPVWTMWALAGCAALPLLLIVANVDSRLTLSTTRGLQPPAPAGLTGTTDQPADNTPPARLLDSPVGGRGELEGAHFDAGRVAPALGGSQVESTVQVFHNLNRHIIYRGSLDLIVADVAAAARKVETSIRAELGEYIESSNFASQTAAAEAILRLRVRSERFAEAIASLRTFGKVASERTESDDATTQMVDLEARLRKERQIEAELLRLLNDRKDAPLEDILRVRSTLAEVRERIERLSAHKELLARQVTFATLTVTLKPEPPTTPPPPPAQKPTFGDEIADIFSSAVQSGAKGAARLLALMVASVVTLAPVLVLGLVLGLGWTLLRRKSGQKH